MDAKIAEIISQTDQISTFVFMPQHRWDWQPGQWMYVKLDDNLKHHFTISSSPTEDFLQITTMFRPESEYKRMLFKMKVGDTVDVAGPHGSFVLSETDLRPRLFVAGGIGITPFRSMIKYSQDKDLDLDISLLYSLKNRRAGVFVDELAQAKIIQTDSQGRLDKRKISKLVPDYGSRTWWICGPAGFVDGMKELAVKMGVGEEKIMSEDFPGY